jgi:glucokinase
MEEFVLGIDIGGTKTAYGLVDLDGNVINENVTPTKDFTSASDLVDSIYHDLRQKDLIKSLKAIGIGAPNGNHFSGSIDFAPNLHWKGKIPLVKYFQEKMKVQTILTNDANAAAYGEKIYGNAQDLSDFVTITLGTGVGSGIVINNELIHGANGIAGEYGHIRVIPNGRVCGCGRRGCLETYASSTGVARSIVELKSDNKMISGLKWIENPSSKDVFDAEEKGDLFAEEIVDFTAQILGSSLADFAAFSDPQAYVLFGGIAQSGDKFAKKVKFYLEQNILNVYKDRIEIRISSLHDKNAAVLGAAAIAFWKTKK